MTTRFTTLPNGLRVITHDMPGLETATVGLWVGSGARSEPAHLNGISHMLEHMAFKGTRRRTARMIAEEIEAVGGDINAATSLEATAYYARVLKEDVGLAIDVLADILTDATFETVELGRERDVILQEIAATNDMPDEVAHDAAQLVAFPDQALGRPILGTEETVSGIGREDLFAHLAAHYRGERLVLSAAGRVDHEAVVALAEGPLAALASGAPDVDAPGAYEGGALQIERPSEQAHVILALKSVGYRDPRMQAVQLLSALLGGGLSSRLFQEVREKRGLSYSVYSYASGFSDVGVFGIYAGTGSEQVVALRDIVVDQLIDVAMHGPTEAELARAKAQIRAGLAMALESSGARAEQMARHVLAHGRALTMEELIARVERVTLDDIRTVAGDILTEAAPTWVAVGEGLPRHDQEALSQRLAGATAH